MFGFQVITLFLLVGSALSWTAPNYDLENAEQHFAEFVKEYNRRYESYEEYSKRLGIFTRKLELINQWNEQDKSEYGGYAIGPHDDLEANEIPSCLKISQTFNETEAIKVKREFIVNAPDSLDYRQQNLVTPVKDQGECGTCFVFAAVGSIEGMHAKQSGELISLSEQQGFDCTHEDCKTGGDPYNVMNILAKQGGSMSEDDYPYIGAPGTCNTDASKIKVKVTGGQRYDTPDIDSMKGALVQNGAPLATCLYVSDQFRGAQGFKVVSPTDCTGQAADHAVTVVGYGTEASTGKNYWIIKNSWGTSRGDGGYFYLDMNMNSQCNFGKWTSGATVA